MNVQPVNSSPKTNHIKMYYDCSKMAGYSAFWVTGLALFQGIRNKKSHKTLGLLAAILASVHVALIEAMQRTADHKNKTV